MTSTMVRSRGGRRHSALLLQVLLLGVAAARTTPSSALRRYLNRKMQHHQHSGLGRHRDLQQAVLSAQPAVMDSSRSVSIDLVGQYFHETKQNDSSVSVIERTHRSNARVLRRRKRTQEYRSKRRSSSGSSSSKGHGYYRPTGPKSSKGKGKKSRSKKDKSPKGSKRSKEAKGSKGSIVSKGGISSKSLKKICRDLDFSEFYDGGYFYNGVSSKQTGSGGYYLVGKGKRGKRERRQLHEKHDRSLQFEGQLCSLNTFDVARVDPDLSIFAELIEAANLQDIFLCAGMRLSVMRLNSFFLYQMF